MLGFGLLFRLVQRLADGGLFLFLQVLCGELPEGRRYDVGIPALEEHQVAVIVRLAVYAKGKNARKYRKGIEYGSARWGTSADIAPYVDPVPDWNIPLTQTEKLTMSSRPKNPKYARNKNILVIGGSGSGKTRFFVKPSLMQMHSSYVVTDPNGNLQ